MCRVLERLSELVLGSSACPRGLASRRHRGWHREGIERDDRITFTTPARHGRRGGGVQLGSRPVVTLEKIARNVEATESLLTSANESRRLPTPGGKQ